MAEQGTPRETTDAEHGLAKKRQERSLDDNDADSEKNGCFAGGNRKCLVGLAAVFVALVLAGIVILVLLLRKDSGTDNELPEGASMLEQIVDRGFMKCGVRDTLGFSKFSANGDVIGFDADLCRAVAAAIFGEPLVEFTLVTGSSRFPTLHSKQVDVLSTITTHTMQRDVAEPNTGAGFTFATPHLYNGLVFAGVPRYTTCIDNFKLAELGQLLGTTGGNATVSDPDCSGLSVCVKASTTHVDVARSILPDDGTATIIEVSDQNVAFQKLVDRTCNVVAGEQFDVAESVAQLYGYSGQYALGAVAFSKEPLAMVTREDDAQWSDFVNYVVQGLIKAEEEGVTQASVQVPQARTLVFGEQFQDMLVHSISAVGNYGEMYARHLEPIVSRAPVNRINIGTSGLIYAMPLGSATGDGPGPVSGGTMERIVRRGHLVCGISKRNIFASRNPSTLEWSGFDVDYCKALSAALFQGETSTIVYVELTASERFQALANGDVDVLARITTVTMEREALEMTTGVGFSFSQPTFYDALSFGGLPPYGTCADSSEFIGFPCDGLSVCVNEGTTFVDLVHKRFDERYVVMQSDSQLTLEGIASGVCTTIGAGMADVSTTSIRAAGYNGRYEEGRNRFSKEPLALVTRQGGLGDAQWSQFVYWVVSSLFLAEEEGITREEFGKMPMVNLFGPSYTTMFQNAVGAVGSYRDIYIRNVQQEIPRGGVHQLNVDPLRPQHYPYPGISFTGAPQAL